MIFVFKPVYPIKKHPSTQGRKGVFEKNKYRLMPGVKLWVCMLFHV